MNRPVILTAGKATRCGPYAPDGCKALVQLDGRPIIEHQLEVLGGDAVIVCRPEHAKALQAYGTVVVNDRCRGAADALASALTIIDEPFTVAYADTYFTEVPEGSDWVGVWVAKGGRSWDVVRDGFVNYEHVSDGWTAKVHVGLSSFSDPERVERIIDRLLHRTVLLEGKELGLDAVFNVYQPWKQEPIPSWKDVGSVEAIEAWAA